MVRIRREAVVDGCDGGDVRVLEEVGEGGDEGEGGLEGVAEGAAVDVAGWGGGLLVEGRGGGREGGRGEYMRL